ncbi:hypothetical protein HYW21_05850 [Candidatus Woesearchaeota archaeon]|nr:hypothetical protein [Candidatus Woesearchaeota archaeon]
MRLAIISVVMLLLSVHIVWAGIGFSGKTLYEGNIIESGDLQVYMYDQPAGGVLLYSELFPSAVQNGYFDIELNPSSLIYGKTYYLDVAVNGTNIDFDGSDRKEVVWWQGRIQDLDESLTIHTNNLSPSLTVQQENNATTLAVQGPTTAADITVLEVTGLPGNGNGIGGAQLGFFKRSSNDQVRLGVNPLTATYGYGSSLFYRNLDSTATAIPVVLIQQDNVNDDQYALKILQDAPVAGLYVENSVAANNAFGARIYATEGAVSNSAALFLRTDVDNYAYLMSPARNIDSFSSTFFYRNKPATSGPVFQIKQDNAADVQSVLWLDQAGNANALIANKYLDTAEATGQFRDQSLGNNLNRAVFARGDSQDRRTAYFYRNVASSNTGKSVVEITNDNALDDQPSLYVTSNSASKAALRIEPKADAPTTCAIGDIYIDSSGAYCTCVSSNAWENIVSVGSCT